MFGLMKNTGCTKADQQNWYRKHYCGTCKAIGSQYGHRSRMLLNFDCVFLAELLSLIQEADTRLWHEKLSPRSCFAIPAADELPLSLQYAADINLIFAEMKVRDNIRDGDGKPFVWKIAQRLYRNPFSKISDRLAAWGIDRQQLLAYQEADAKRENEPPVSENIADLLAYHAAPTAAITAYLFAKGTEAVQRPSWREAMADIGAAFGELVYGLDAWKDVEKDAAEGAFNLLLLHPDRPVEETKQQTADWLWQKAAHIQTLIQQADFSEEVKAALHSRLQLNLAVSLGEAPQACNVHAPRKATVPAIAKALRKIRQGMYIWLNPLRPARFVASYIALLLVVFHQQLFAIADFQADESFSIDYVLLGALIAAPIGMYFAAKGISKNRFWLALSEKYKEKRAKRRQQRKEKKPGKSCKEMSTASKVVIACGSLCGVACCACSCYCVSVGDELCEGCENCCDAIEDCNF